MINACRYSETKQIYGKLTNIQTRLADLNNRSSIFLNPAKAKMGESRFE